MRRTRRSCALAVTAALLISCTAGGSDEPDVATSSTDSDSDEVAQDPTGDDAADDATDPDATTDTDATTDPDGTTDDASPPAGGATDGPFARPDEPDPAYADAVINELFRLAAEVERDVRDRTSRGQTIPPELLEPLQAVSSARQFEQYAAELQEQVNDSFATAPATIEQLTFTTDRITVQDDGCLAVAGTYDITGPTDVDAVLNRFPDVVGDDFTGVFEDYGFLLVPLDAERDPDGINPTGWMIEAESGEADIDWSSAPLVVAPNCG